jgi:peptide subunit release factor 1 (eRF1)
MPITEQLDSLARFEPVPYPVISLYLNTQPNERGRDQYQTFVRQEFKARSRTFPTGSPERESLDRDLERINAFLEGELQPAANGVAIFACSAGEMFEAVQLTAPIDRHSLYIGDAPHLYPLARVESKYPSYAAVVADTNRARILVFATNELVSEQEIVGEKTRSHSQGGWSQARFQRHIENFHVQHAKEIVEALDRIVQQEGITQILTAGDEVILPLLREQMPKHLSEKVVDHLKLDAKAPLGTVLAATIEAMSRENERTDKEKVQAAIDAYRANALGVVGPEDTLDALIKGQVDELLLAANVDALRDVSNETVRAIANDSTLLEPAVEPVAAGEATDATTRVVRLADELVRRAKQTGATVTFIEDPTLLQDYGGVAALLRFTI